MPSLSREVEHPDFGTIILRKVRGAKNIRLRLPPKGGVLVTLPTFVPYRTALNYALKQREWIASHQIMAPTFKTGDKIGHSHSFDIQPAPLSTINARRTGQRLVVRYPQNLQAYDSSVQQAAYKLAIRALRYEAAEILPMWLNRLAREHGFAYEECLLRQLRARWGSCSSHKVITLNIFLMMLPEHLIEYVLLHELTHTEHLNHSAAFWTRLEQALPQAKKLRRELKQHNPAL